MQRVAQVCRLRLGSEEREALRKDLNSILEYFSQISEIEEKGRELYYVLELESKPRKDEELPCDEAPAIRSQFARSKEGKMLAPKGL